MEVYIQLTKKKENAFNNINDYNDIQNILYNCKIASTEWLYCKQDKDIKDCYGFDELELEKVEGNINYYKYKRKTNFLPNILNN